LLFYVSSLLVQTTIRLRKPPGILLWIIFRKPGKLRGNLLCWCWDKRSLLRWNSWNL